MKNNIIALSAVLLCAVLCSACQTVPYSERSQFLLTSVDEENSLGTQAWQETCKTEKETTNKDAIAALKRVGPAIAAVADRSDFKWEFKMFESTTANAFCLPGGKVAVYTGILAYMANDAELAAVVGHEVGHAVARHGGERMSQAMVQEVGNTALALALDASGTSNAALYATAYGIATNVGVILPYSRKHEYEADYIGMILMAKAGYDPGATIDFWKKFSAEDSSNSLTVFLSTHPMSSDRIAQMEKHLPEAMGYYRGAKVQHGLGNPIKYTPSPQTQKADQPKIQPKKQDSGQSQSSLADNKNTKKQTKKSSGKQTKRYYE